MGNSQTALSGIHPFKDAENTDPSPRFIPPAQIKNMALPELPSIVLPNPNAATTNQTISSQLSTVSTIQNQPQQLALGWTSITSDPQPEKFDDLFVVKAPTPPPRRISYNEAGKPNRRLPKQGFLGRGFSSLRTLPRLISRPDLAKIRGFFRRKRVVGEVYPVPPDAEKPSPPSKPEVFHEQDEYFLLRWDPPAYDGGLPIIGYIIQHLELGLPQVDQTVEKDDTQSWFSSEPGQVTSTEVLLNNLIPGTTYQFRVIAENLLGFSQPSDISTPIVFNPNGELDDWFCPPVIIISLDESYTVIEHERLVLAVEITGQPYPIVKWYGNDGMELGKFLDPVKYGVVSCGQRRVLTINAVDCGDSGVIRCVGENERGVVECSCVVVVEAPPHVRRVLRSDLIKLENPYELSKDEERLVRRQDKNDEELMFQSGELARFKFLYSGSPSPNICVYHEGDLVDGEEVVGSGKIYHERVTSEVTENLITVKIAGVKRSDRGEWTVRLDNVLGEDSASVLVTITDRPSEPGKPDVLQLSDNTVILKWDQPYDDGGCPVSGYIVEYFRSEWGVWLKACTTKNPYTKIRDLIPGSKYTFRVKAENLYGMSDPSSESVELLITDLASTLRSVAGDDGEGALLMQTVVEEEEEAVKIEEEEPGKRKQGSSISLNRVSAGTMTDLSALGKGGGSSSTADIPFTDEYAQEAPTSGTSPPIKSHHSPPQRHARDGISPPHPPRKTLRLESPTPPDQARTPSPSRLLKVTLQPHVVILDDEEEYPDEEEDVFLQFQPPPPRRSPSPHVIKAPPSPRRSPSPGRMPAPPSPRRSPSPSPVAPPRISRTVTQQPTHIDEEAIAITRSQEFSHYSSPKKIETSLAPQPPVPPPRHQLSTSPSSTLTSPQQVLQQQAPKPPSPRPPPTIPVVTPIEQPKKLYSRSEIIRSAATNEMDYYYLSLTEENPPPGEEEERVEEPEEDPELLKVKEALSKDDHLFDDLDDEEDEDIDVDIDFEKLQEEYEADKRKGIVSRQDSGVSARSAEQGSVSRGESFNEGDEEVQGDGRSRSVMSEVLPKTKSVFRMGSFERAQSEVVSSRDKPAPFDYTLMRSSEVVKVEEIESEEQVVPPPVEPRRTVSPSPQRSFGGGGGGYTQRSQSQSGSKTMLHDRFTDYIAMKASSRNKQIGSSLRSLNSSRYSSREDVGQGSSRDSGRSSMQHQESHGEAKSFFKQFSWREFDAKQEGEALRRLERSVSVPGKGLSIFTISQQKFLEAGGDGEEEEVGVGEVQEDMQVEGMEEAGGVRRSMNQSMEETRARSDRDTDERVNRFCDRGFECAFISTPEIYSSERERGDQSGFGVLEHSRSESHMGASEVPDSGLKERILTCHVPGGVDYETEEESCSGVDGGGVFSAISEEGEGSGEGKESGSGGGVDREVPRDRETRRLRKRVSFGSSDVEEISWDDGRGRSRGREREEEEEMGDQAEDEEVGEEEMGDEEGEGGGEGEDEGNEEVEEDVDEPHEEEREAPDDTGAIEGGEFLEEYEEEEPFERGDETHAGEDEFDDDGEVFEMDIEGIDPRVYAEEDAEFEGEEDSGSGVMYVLLEPEEIKLRDIGEFDEGAFSGRDEKLESLLLKIDQFLGEEEEIEGAAGGGSYVEEIAEGDEEEEEHVEEEVEHVDVGELESGVEEVAEEILEVDKVEVENVGEEQTEVTKEEKLEQVPEKMVEGVEQKIEIEEAQVKDDFGSTPQDVESTELGQQTLEETGESGTKAEETTSSHPEETQPTEEHEVAKEELPPVSEPEPEAQPPDNKEKILSTIEYDERIEVFDIVDVELVPAGEEHVQDSKQKTETTRVQETAPEIIPEDEVPEEEEEMPDTMVIGRFIIGHHTPVFKEPPISLPLSQEKESPVHEIPSTSPETIENTSLQEEPSGTKPGSVGLPINIPEIKSITTEPQVKTQKVELAPQKPTTSLKCDIQPDQSSQAIITPPKPPILPSATPQLPIVPSDIPKPPTPPKLETAQPPTSAPIKRLTPSTAQRDTAIELPPPPPPQQQMQQRPLPTLHHIPDGDSADRIEPPPPPPRPATFSYKHYMTEKQRQPPQQAYATHMPHRSRESSRSSQSVSSLPTVKEEPSNGTTRQHTQQQKQPQHPVSSPPPRSAQRPSQSTPESTYKPNMSVYMSIHKPSPRSPPPPQSLRSSASSLFSNSSQELPQTPCLLPRVFKSPTEDDDPPVVSIEEIRARIEQNRLELLKPLHHRNQPEEEQVQIVAKKVVKKRSEEDNAIVAAPISPFMNYLFNAAFYLMLSPMLMFVDSLYFGLLALLLVACVHFFVIRQL